MNITKSQLKRIIKEALESKLLERAVTRKSMVEPLEVPEPIDVDWARIRKAGDTVRKAGPLQFRPGMLRGQPAAGEIEKHGAKMASRADLSDPNLWEDWFPKEYAEYRKLEKRGLELQKKRNYMKRRYYQCNEPSTHCSPPGQWPGKNTKVTIEYLDVIKKIKALQKKVTKEVESDRSLSKALAKGRGD
jgi:hypothetical protein